MPNCCRRKADQGEATRSHYEFIAKLFAKVCKRICLLYSFNFCQAACGRDAGIACTNIALGFAETFWSCGSDTCLVVREHLLFIAVLVSRIWLGKILSFCFELYLARTLKEWTANDDLCVLVLSLGATRATRYNEKVYQHNRKVLGEAFSNPSDKLLGFYGRYFDWFG